MHRKLGTDGTKFGCTKVTHKKTHEELDGIDLEGYESHLSNQARSKYAGDVHGQPPFLNAVSGIVVVSKISNVLFCCTTLNLRSSEAVMYPDRSVSTKRNHDQILGFKVNKSCWIGHACIMHLTH